jgi:ATP-binding cassette subfamily B protein
MTTKVLVLVGLGLLGFGLTFARRFYGGKVSLGVQYLLRTKLFEHFQRLDFTSQEQLQTGQLVSRANADVGLIQGLLAFLPRLLGNLLLTLGSVVVMLILYWPLGLVIAATLPILLWASVALRSKVFPASWDAQQREGAVVVTAEEAISGIAVVKSATLERSLVATLRHNAAALFASRARTVRLSAKLQALLQWIPMMSQAVVIGLGGYAAYAGHISIGTFLLFATFVAELDAPVRQLAAVVAIGEQARAGAERIFGVFDMTPQITEPEEPEVPMNFSSVTFSDVVFGYEPGRPVINGVSIEIGSGERVAIVGSAGSGKSTMSLLLPRFYDPQQGSIAVGGVDLRQISLESLRAKVGIVFEDAFLFADTIARNIGYGRPDATMDMIEHAARAAHIHDYITSLPLGYDTLVGERGIRLSGGQRQRIALARALLGEPDLLILDDATSAVDADTESEIHEALLEYADGRTLLLIAHRRSTLALADRIVVMDEGAVVDDGTEEELLRNSEIFRSIMDPDEFGESNRIDEPVVFTDGSATVTAGLVDRASTRTGPGRRGAGFALAETESLRRALESLPPATDQPRLDLGEYDPMLPVGFRFGRLLRALRAPILIGFVLVALDALLSLVGPASVRGAIDSGVLHHRLFTVLGAAALLAVASCADVVVVWLEGVVTGMTAERFLYGLRVKIFEQLMRVGMDYYETEVAGRVLTRMTSDVDAFSNLMQSGFVQALVSIVSFLGAVVVLIFMSPRLIVVPLATFPLLGIATVWYQRFASRAYERSRERIAMVNANFQEGVSGVRVNQAFVREEASAAHFRGLAARYRDSRMSAQTAISIYFPFILLLSDVAAALTLAYGGYLVTHHEIQIGTVIAYVLYLDLFFSPIQQLSQTFDQFQQASVAVRQIRRLLSIQPNITLEPTPEPPFAIRGEVSFDRVAFGYHAGDRAALEGISFKVEPGMKVALVGETGAGKSTIAKLLIRFYDPSAGTIRLDGHDITKLDLNWYRSQVGYLPQEAYLFSGSLEYNIALGRTGASSEEIRRAAHEVGVEEFARSLPGGLNFDVGERGRMLSSGQRQLVALARLYLSAPSLLVLDEVSSSLDLRSEAVALRAIDAICRGRTTFVIAHRLPSARDADLVVVLESGRIAQMGTHDELRVTPGRYRRLWDIFEGIESAEPEEEGVSLG